MDRPVRKIEFVQKPCYQPPSEPLVRSFVIKACETTDLLVARMNALIATGASIVEACAKVRHEKPYANMEAEKLQALFIKAIEVIKHQHEKDNEAEMGK